MAFYDSIRDMPDMAAVFFKNLGETVGAAFGAAKNGVMGLGTFAENIVDMVRGGDQTLAQNSEPEISAPKIAPAEAKAAPITDMKVALAELPSNHSEMLQMISDNPIRVAYNDLSPAGEWPGNSFSPDKEMKSAPKIVRSASQGITA